MRFTNIWSVISVGLATSQAVAFEKRAADIKNAPETIPNRYIVEFADSEEVTTLADPVENFFRALRKTGIEAKPGFNITSSVFRGASFTVYENATLEDIVGLREVRNIWPVQKVRRPEPIVEIAGSGAAPKWNSHTHTGVLDLHKRGIQGEGAIVAVVDTGIDYTHPTLGGGIGPGFKIDSGVDIVGDDFWGDIFFPDDDPMDAQGHGTHVAGIIGGSGETDFIGVAPKATLRAYKVFGNYYDYTTTDALIHSFVTAYEDGADVISASIGGSSGWSEDSWAVVADRLAKKGVFVSISAGNSGAAGLWYASSGSSGEEAIAVGSVNSDQIPGSPFTITSENGTTSDYGYMASAAGPFTAASNLTVYATSADPNVLEDACTELPADTPDLSNSLVLIRRGACSFALKAAHAMAHGAENILFYNTPNSPLIQPGISPLPEGLNFGMITYDLGAQLVSQFASGAELTASFPEGASQSPIENDITGAVMSSFSSWGPTWDASSKPDISAPGGYIYSTYPLSMGGHAVLSGTSMAAPYISGLAALYIAKAGGRDALGPNGIYELRQRIMTSGNMLPWNDNTATDPNTIAPVAQQGAGCVSGPKIFQDTYISPGKIQLNDTVNFKSRHEIKVKNYGRKTVRYTVSHVPAGTVLTFTDLDGPVSAYPPPFADGAATVRFSQKKFAVRPGATNTLRAFFAPPRGLDPRQLPIYSGFIVIENSLGESYSVPYQGILGSVFSVDMWAAGDLNYLHDATGEVITGAHNWTLSDDDRPATLFWNRWGSKEIRWDVVEKDWRPKDWKYPPVEGKNKFVGSVYDSHSWESFPWLLNPRTDFTEDTNYNLATWNGDLSNGTTLTFGTYKFVWRALRVGGNTKRNDNWQTVVSPEFTIRPAPNGDSEMKQRE